MSNHGMYDAFVAFVNHQKVIHSSMFVGDGNKN